MENKITVKEFINMINSSEQDIKNILIKRTYVPFAEKVNAAKAGIQKYNLQNEDIITDTPMTYLCYVATILRLYTNLDISSTETDKDYDLLQENGLVEFIFELLSDDLKEFQSIFDMCKEDFRANYLSAPGFVQKQINKITGVCEKGVVKLMNWLDTLDTEKLTEVLQTYNPNK